MHYFHFWEDYGYILISLGRIHVTTLDPAFKADYVAQIRAIDCLGLIFPSLPITVIADSPMISKKIIQSQRRAFQLLFSYFVNPPLGSVWSVRAACYRALSVVLARSYVLIDEAEANRLANADNQFRRGPKKEDMKAKMKDDDGSNCQSEVNENSVLTRDTVLKSLDAIVAGVKDTKYSLIRVAALECLIALLERKESRIRDMLLPLCDDFSSSIAASSTENPLRFSIKGILKVLEAEEEPRVNMVKERAITLLNKY